MAALRWIVLPWGATSGLRMILDAIRGVIELYDAADVEVILIGSDGTDQVIRVQDGAGNTLTLFVDSGLFNTPVIEMTNVVGGLGCSGAIRGNAIGVAGTTAQMEMITWSQGVGSGADANLTVRSGSTDLMKRAEVAVDVPVVVDGETWHTLIMGNGWIVDTNTPQYRLMPDWTVLLRGWGRNGTTLGNTVIATFPAGYRPQGSSYHVCAMPNSNTNQATVFVNSVGELRIASMPAATVSFDGLRFPVSSL